MMLSQRNMKSTHKNHLDYVNFKNIGHNFKVFPSIVELQVAFSLEVLFTHLANKKIKMLGCI